MFQKQYISVRCAGMRGGCGAIQAHLLLASPFSQRNLGFLTTQEVLTAAGPLSERSLIGEFRSRLAMNGAKRFGFVVAITTSPAGASNESACAASRSALPESGPYHPGAALTNASSLPMLNVFFLEAVPVSARSNNYRHNYPASAQEAAGKPFSNGQNLSAALRLADETEGPESKED